MATAAPRRTLLGRMGLRKSVELIQHETRTSELKRSLGPWNLVFLGIGCIIGAGCIIGHHEATKHERERERAYHEGYGSGAPPYDRGDGYGPR